MTTLLKTTAFVLLTVFTFNSLDAQDLYGRALKKKLETHDKSYELASFLSLDFGGSIQLNADTITGAADLNVGLRVINRPGFMLDADAERGIVLGRITPYNFSLGKNGMISPLFTITSDSRIDVGETIYGLGANVASYSDKLWAEFEFNMVYLKNLQGRRYDAYVKIENGNIGKWTYGFEAKGSIYGDVKDMSLDTRNNVFANGFIGMRDPMNIVEGGLKVGYQKHFSEIPTMNDGLQVSIYARLGFEFFGQKTVWTEKKK